MISVIIPVYNGEKYILSSVQSILNQTEKDFELIIINDGSTDGTEEIVKSIEDQRIRYFKKENGGTSSALNMGIELSVGDFIAWQAADDLSLPTRLEMSKKQFTHEKIGVVHTDMLLIANDSPIAYWQSRNFDRSRLIRFFLKVGSPFNGGSLMMRREVLRDLRFKTKYKIGEDTEFIFRFSPSWDSLHIPEPLYIYRKHETNTSNNNDYSTIYAHVQDYLEEHSVKELIPELPWNTGSENLNSAKGYAIMALLLFRRGMTPDCDIYYKRSIQLAEGDKQTILFIKGIGSLIINKPQQALNDLLSCETRDHITENYIGEALSYLGDHTTALTHFLRSLELSPKYEEPMDNLRALGAINSYNMLDNSWRKFA